MIAQIGAENLLFTNVSAADIQKHFSAHTVCFRTQPFAEVLRAECDADFAQRVCLLDSEAETLLKPEDAAQFTFFLLGGILGNVDEFDADRTQELRRERFATRNLQAQQMTTDTAAIVTARVVLHGTSFENLAFVDRPEFGVSTDERLIVPFRFLAADGDANKPLIADGILDILQRENEF